MWRRQLPVYSPLSVRDVLAGLGALARGRQALTTEVTGRVAAAWHARGALLTDSGTSALTLALRLVHQEAPGRAIALPAYGCYDLATAVVGAGVPIRFYDLDPETLGPDLPSLESAVTQDLGGIVLAYLYGMPFDLRPVLEMTLAREIPIIEDAAQGLGMIVDSRISGTIGDLAVLSFGRGKGLTAGRGGALLTDQRYANAIIAEDVGDLGPSRGVAREILALGAQFLFARPSLYRLPAALPWLRLGDTVYRPPHPPRQPTAFALGVLGSTLGTVETETSQRRAHADEYRAVLAGSARVTTPRVPISSIPGYLRFPVVGHEVSALTSRDVSHGIMPGYPSTLPRLEVLRSRAINATDSFPGAERLAATLVTLPTHSRLTARDLTYLSTWLAHG